MQLSLETHTPVSSFLLPSAPPPSPGDPTADTELPIPIDDPARDQQVHHCTAPNVLSSVHLDIFPLPPYDSSTAVLPRPTVPSNVPTIVPPLPTSCPLPSVPSNVPPIVPPLPISPSVPSNVPTIVPHFYPTPSPYPAHNDNTVLPLPAPPTIPPIIVTPAPVTQTPVSVVFTLFGYHCIWQIVMDEYCI